MDNERHIHVYNFVTRELEYEIDFKVQLSSVSISQDSCSLLVLTNEGDARLIDLDSRETIRIFRSGDKESKNVIKAAFGGANESFVITGSESKFEFWSSHSTNTNVIGGAIYIWHKENGKLIEKLDGHDKGCCSAVSWNPANPCMFASAGDDAKVRM